jgi:molybdate transport system substrate-binding protein
MGSIVQKTCLALLAVLISAGMAAAAEVRLISVGGVKGALDKIIADYTKETGNEVKYTVGSPLVVSQKLAAGEAFDVVVQSAPAMGDYAKIGGVKVETRVPVARGGIGMAIRQDAATPDISTVDKFKRELLATSSIGVGDPAMPNGSGILAQSILTNSGMMNAIKFKVKVVGLDPGQEQIAKGELDMGLFNVSEIRSFVKYVGPVPAPLQQYTNYEAAVTTKSAATEPATALVKMLAGPAAAERWKSGGLEPQSAK